MSTIYTDVDSAVAISTNWQVDTLQWLSVSKENGSSFSGTPHKGSTTLRSYTRSMTAYSIAQKAFKTFAVNQPSGGKLLVFDDQFRPRLSNMCHSTD